MIFPRKYLFMWVVSILKTCHSNLQACYLYVFETLSPVTVIESRSFDDKLLWRSLLIASQKWHLCFYSLLISAKHYFVMAIFYTPTFKVRNYSSLLHSTNKLLISACSLAVVDVMVPTSHFFGNPWFNYFYSKKSVFFNAPGNPKDKWVIISCDDIHSFISYMRQWFTPKGKVEDS